MGHRLARKTNAPMEIITVKRLQTYNYEIKHRKGSSHGNADALSRRPCPLDCRYCGRLEERAQAEEVRTIQVATDNGWTPEELAAAQRADEDLSCVIDWKEAGQRPSWQDVSKLSPATKNYWAQWDSLHLENGLLKRKWESANGSKYVMQIVVPKSRTTDVLQEMHGGPTGGHMGMNKTLDRIRSKFYWVHARSDVENWCRNCTVCAAVKGPRRRLRGPMQVYNVGAPFERIAVDIAGPYPESRKGNRYMLVVADYFSRWPEVYPIPNQEAQTVAEEIVTNWISRYGVPLELHSDQGRNFESQLFRELCRLLGINKTRTTPLHPQSDGMVERFNQTVIKHLAKVVEENQQDWDQQIPLFLMAYRNTAHTTTAETPSKVLFGSTMRTPADVKYGTPPATPQSVTTYIEELRQRLDRVHREVRTTTGKNTDKTKTRYDVKGSSTGFRDDELVWLYNPRRRKGRCPKLQRNWDGPYKIIKKINDVVYRIQEHGKPRAKLKVVNLERLAPYTSSQNEETV